MNSFELANRKRNWFQRPYVSLGSKKINFFQPERVLLFLLLFLLVFPKGGIKLGGIPLTWGYFFLGLFSFFSLFKKAYSIKKERLLSLVLLVPFQALSLGTLLMNGIGNKGMAVSLFVSFIVIPFVFFFLFSKGLEEINLERFFKLLKKGVLFISFYGIFLFFFKFVTGKFIEIPFLTTNFSDLGGLEGKCINRGSIFKLISTYNNGNIYGICLLMILPLYQLLEERKWAKRIVKLSLLLTLARTIWIGMVFHEIFFLFFLAKKKNLLFQLGIFLTVFLFSLFVVLFAFDFRMEFLLDTNLGGRLNQIQVFSKTGLFSSNPFEGILDIIYAGILHAFGWMGLFAFLLGVSTPIRYLLVRRNFSLIQKAVLLGLFNYLFIGMSDGALLFVPTMAFYWFLASFLYNQNIKSSKDASKDLCKQLPPFPS